MAIFASICDIVRHNELANVVESGSQTVIYDHTCNCSRAVEMLLVTGISAPRDRSTPEVAVESWAPHGAALIRKGAAPTGCLSRQGTRGSWVPARAGPTSFLPERAVPRLGVI